MHRFERFLRDQPIFVVAAILAPLAIIFGHVDMGLINIEVIVTLFTMMLALGLLQSSNVLNVLSIYFIKRSGHSRRLVQLIAFISFVSSLLLSNDIAVLTLLPIYFYMLSSIDKGFKGQVFGAVLIVIAANLGGVVFPFSNPQNLIIYDALQPTFPEFMRITGVLALVGLGILMKSTYFVQKTPISTRLELDTIDRKQLAWGLLSLATVIMSVFGFVSIYLVTPIVMVVVFFVKKTLFARVDYPLLTTFFCFFIIVGAVSNVSFVDRMLTGLTGSHFSTFMSTIVVSQFTSNVPATLLFLPYTDNLEALLLGANIGGLGSLFASMANLIGFNQVRKYERRFAKDYLWLSLGVNLAFLLILVIIFGLLIF